MKLANFPFSKRRTSEDPRSEQQQTYGFSTTNPINSSKKNANRPVLKNRFLNDGSMLKVNGDNVGHDLLLEEFDDAGTSVYENQDSADNNRHDNYNKDELFCCLSKDEKENMDDKDKELIDIARKIAKANKYKDRLLNELCADKDLLYKKLRDLKVKYEEVIQKDLENFLCIKCSKILPKDEKCKHFNIKDSREENCHGNLENSKQSIGVQKSTDRTHLNLAKESIGVQNSNDHNRMWEDDLNHRDNELLIKISDFENAKRIFEEQQIKKLDDINQLQILIGNDTHENDSQKIFMNEIQTNFSNKNSSLAGGQSEQQQRYQHKDNSESILLDSAKNNKKKMKTPSCNLTDYNQYNCVYEIEQTTTPNIQGKIQAFSSQMISTSPDNLLFDRNINDHKHPSQKIEPFSHKDFYNTNDDRTAGNDGNYINSGLTQDQTNVYVCSEVQISKSPQSSFIKDINSCHLKVDNEAKHKFNKIDNESHVLVHRLNYDNGDKFSKNNKNEMKKDKQINFLSSEINQVNIDLQDQSKNTNYKPNDFPANDLVCKKLECIFEDCDIKKDCKDAFENIDNALIDEEDTPDSQVNNNKNLTNSNILNSQFNSVFNDINPDNSNNHNIENVLSENQYNKSQHDLDQEHDVQVQFDNSDDEEQDELSRLGIINNEDFDKSEDKKSESFSNTPYATNKDIFQFNTNLNKAERIKEDIMNFEERISLKNNLSLRKNTSKTFLTNSPNKSKYTNSPPQNKDEVTPNPISLNSDNKDFDNNLISPNKDKKAEGIHISPLDQTLKNIDDQVWIKSCEKVKQNNRDIDSIHYNQKSQIKNFAKIQNLPPLSISDKTSYSHNSKSLKNNSKKNLQGLNNTGSLEKDNYDEYNVCHQTPKYGMINNGDMVNPDTFGKYPGQISLEESSAKNNLVQSSFNPNSSQNTVNYICEKSSTPLDGISINQKQEFSKMFGSNANHQHNNSSFDGNYFNINNECDEMIVPELDHQSDQKNFYKQQIDSKDQVYDSQIFDIPTNSNIKNDPNYERIQSNFENQLDNQKLHEELIEVNNCSVDTTQQPPNIEFLWKKSNDVHLQISDNYCIKDDNYCIEDGDRLYSQDNSDEKSYIQNQQQKPYSTCGLNGSINGQKKLSHYQGVQEDVIPEVLEENDETNEFTTLAGIDTNVNDDFVKVENYNNDSQLEKSQNRLKNNFENLINNKINGVRKDNIEMDMGRHALLMQQQPYFKKKDKLISDTKKIKEKLAGKTPNLDIYKTNPNPHTTKEHLFKTISFKSQVEGSSCGAKDTKLKRAEKMKNDLFNRHHQEKAGSKLSKNTKPDSQTQQTNTDPTKNPDLTDNGSLDIENNKIEILPKDKKINKHRRVTINLMDSSNDGSENDCGGDTSNNNNQNHNDENLVTKNETDLTNDIVYKTHTKLPPVNPLQQQNLQSKTLANTKSDNQLLITPVNSTKYKKYFKSCINNRKIANQSGCGDELENLDVSSNPRNNDSYNNNNGRYVDKHRFYSKTPTGNRNKCTNDLSCPKRECSCRSKALTPNYSSKGVILHGMFKEKVGYQAKFEEKKSIAGQIKPKKAVKQPLFTNASNKNQQQQDSEFLSNENQNCGGNRFVSEQKSSSYSLTQQQHKGSEKSKNNVTVTSHNKNHLNNENRKRKMPSVNITVIGKNNNNSNGNILGDGAPMDLRHNNQFNKALGDMMNNSDYDSDNFLKKMNNNRNIEEPWLKTNIYQGQNAQQHQRSNCEGSGVNYNNKENQSNQNISYTLQSPQLVEKDNNLRYAGGHQQNSSNNKNGSYHKRQSFYNISHNNSQQNGQHNLQQQPNQSQQQYMIPLQPSAKYHNNKNFGGHLSEMHNKEATGKNIGEGTNWNPSPIFTKDMHFRLYTSESKSATSNSPHSPDGVQRNLHDERRQSLISQYYAYGSDKVERDVFAFEGFL